MQELFAKYFHFCENCPKMSKTHFSTFLIVGNVEGYKQKKEKLPVINIFKGAEQKVFHKTHIFKCGKLFFVKK